MSDSICVSEKDNNRQVKVPLDKALTICLNENPTTGFKWQMQSQAEGILNLVADDFTIPDTSKVGGGGTRRFQFRPVAVGRGTISLRYRRPWEATDTFSKEFVVEVLVE